MNVVGLLRRPAFLCALFVATIIVGVVLVQYGRSLEPYHDAARAADLITAEYCLYSNDAGNDVQSANWYREMDALLTQRYPFMNTGCAVIVATIALALLWFWRLAVSDGDRPLWRTPSKKWHFFAVGSAIIIGSYFSIVYGLSLELERRMLPWCADSIAIPIFGLGLVTLFALPIAIFVGWAVSLFFRELPTSLWEWDAENAVRSWLATVIFGMLVLLWLWISIDAAPTEDFLIVGPCVFATYLTLSCRAAILAPPNDPVAPAQDRATGSEGL